MSDATPLHAGDGNATRTAIFNTLIDSMTEMTPSMVAEEVDTSRENAYKHLQWLVEAGLVVSDGGEYFAQPIFIDPEFQDRIDEVLGNLAPDAEEHIYVPPDLDDDQRVNVVANCIHTAVAQSLLGEDGPPR